MSNFSFYIISSLHSRCSETRVVGLINTVIIVTYFVGDPGKESNASWVIARGAHKKPTYAQMVKASNRVVSEVRKKVSN